MNRYYVTFEYGLSFLVEATDSDMAVINLRKEYGTSEVGMTGLDKQEVTSLVILSDDGKGDVQLKVDALGREIAMPELPEDFVAERDARVARINKLAEKPRKLPSRRQKGMTLSYCDGDLFVTFFGYSASLAVAANEGELHPTASHRYEEYQLTPAQQRIVDEWERVQNDYYEANGWKTWADLYDNEEST